MKLLIICLCTQKHRSSETDGEDEIGWGLHRKLHEAGWLELSDYFVRYEEEYKKRINATLSSKGAAGTFGYKDRMYLVLDGVGGVVNKACKLKGFAQHRQAGTFNAIRLHKPKDTVREILGVKGLWGSAFGHGWNRNVVYALTILNHVWGERHADLCRSVKSKQRHEYYLQRTPQRNDIVEAVENLKKYLARYAHAPKQAGVIPPITKLILIGFSRGAVTTIKLSKALNGNGLHWWRGFDSTHHAMVDVLSLTKLGRGIVQQTGARKTVGYRDFDIFKDVPVHIFAVDPVAGGTAGQTSNETNFTIRENVKSIVCPLSMAENRNVVNFTPVNILNVRGENLGPKLLFLPFPGVHGHVGNRWQTKKKGEKGYREFRRCSATGRLVHHLARKFIGFHHRTIGQVLNEQEKKAKGKDYELKKYNDYELLSLYAEMVINRAHYFYPETAPDFLGKIVAKFAKDHRVRFRSPILHTDWYYHKDIVSRLDYWVPKPNYVDCPYYFINEHHHALFKKRFKDTYSKMMSIAEKEPDTDDSLESVMNAWEKEATKYNLAKRESTLIQMSLFKVYMHYPHLLSSSKGKMLLGGMVDEAWNKEGAKDNHAVRHRKTDKWTNRGGHGSYEKFGWAKQLG